MSAGLSLRYSCRRSIPSWSCKEHNSAVHMTVSSRVVEFGPARVLPHPDAGAAHLAPSLQAAFGSGYLSSTGATAADMPGLVEDSLQAAGCRLEAKWAAAAASILQ